jgi:hypothetical protein
MVNTTLNEASFQRFQDGIHRLTEVFGKDAGEMTAKWCRVLLKDIISRTPPDTRVQGERAVVRDVKKAVEPVGVSKTDFRAFARGDFTWTIFEDSKSIRKVIKKKDDVAFREIMKNIPTLERYTLTKFSSALHKDVIGRRGKVNKSQRKMTLDKEEWIAYTKQVMANVGKLKASWAPAAKALGLKLPSWAERHAAYGDSVTAVDNKLETPAHFISILNQSKGIGRMTDFVNFSMGYISDKMDKDFKFKLNYAIKQAKGGA